MSILVTPSHDPTPPKPPFRVKLTRAVEPKGTDVIPAGTLLQVSRVLTKSYHAEWSFNGFTHVITIPQNACEIQPPPPPRTRPTPAEVGQWLIKREDEKIQQTVRTLATTLGYLTDMNRPLMPSDVQDLENGVNALRYSVTRRDAMREVVK